MFRHAPRNYEVNVELPKLNILPPLMLYVMLCLANILYIYFSMQQLLRLDIFFW